MEVYIERLREAINKKEILNHYNSVANIEKWCNYWNEYTRNYLRLTMYMYNINPYIGIKI